MTQFDATARINVDLTGFARAASRVSSATGAWTTATNSLAASVTRIQTIEKNEAAELNRTLGVYQKISSAVTNYANALQKLTKATKANEETEQKFSGALSSLSTQLSKVEGLSKDEATRIGRTVKLYSELAHAVDTYANALLKMERFGTQAATEENRQAQATAQLTQQQQRLNLAEQRLAQSQQRLDQANQRLARSETQVARSGQETGSVFDHISASTFALRSTLQELESSYQSILNVFVKIPEASGAAAISQESAYAQVARVTGDAAAAANNLFAGLQKISTDLPIDFEATAKIAQLGAQIGITADQLVAFTRVVAAFSITTGITAENATILIGQIAEMEDLPVTEFENFASAVLYLGTVSAATEEEILQINDSIATVSTVFGLSIQGALGLSAALATLRVRPQLARGSLTRVFSKLQDAVDASGHSLQVLAAMMGLTEKQVINLKNTDPDQFFLRFIQGLKNAGESGISFRASLRDLGINAVRDIDTISRLANNFDVLSDAMTDSYAEYAKNTELQRQSQRIYATTANELGNLSDAFKNFLSNAGRPLAEAVGNAAKALTAFLDFINTVPAAVKVVGTAAIGLGVLGAAWLAYRLVMIKTLTTVVAMKEAQRQLQGQSIGLRTVIATLRQDVTSNAAANAEAASSAEAAAGGNAALARSAAAARTAVAAAAREQQAAAAAAARLAVSQDEAAAATARWAASQEITLIPTERLAEFTDLQAASAAAAANAQRALAITSANLANNNTLAFIPTEQLAEFTGLQAAQARLAATAQNALALSSEALAANNRIAWISEEQLAGFTELQAAQARLAAGAQSALAITSSELAAANTAAAASGEAVAVAEGEAAAASRAASVSMLGILGPLGLIAAAAALIVPAFMHQESETEKLTKQSIDAAGGLGQLAKAIKDDTEAAKSGGPIYREITLGVDDLTASTKNAAKEAIANAKAQKDAITLVHGSYEALKQQADGTGESAKAAKAYVAQLDNANHTIDVNTQLLKDNTAVIGDNAKKWEEDAFDAATSASGITKNSDALKMLKATSINVGKILEDSLVSPKKATDELTKATAALQAEFDKSSKGLDPFSDEFIKLVQNTKTAAEFLTAIQGSIDAVGDSAAENAIKQQLLSQKMAMTATQAALAKKGFGDVALALQALGETADGSDVEITNLNETIQGFGTPLDAFSAAYDKAAEKAAKSAKKVKGANEVAADSLTAFSDAGKVSLKEFEKQLDKIQHAMENWAGNIVILAQRLGPDIAKYLEGLGPTAAPLIQKLVDASDKELKKLKPKLEATTTDATTALSGTLLAAIPSIQGASKKTATIISDAFVSQLQAGKVPFEDTVNQFASLVTSLDSVSGKPKIELQTEDAKKSLDQLEDLVLGANKNGTLNPKGYAQLNNQIFNDNLTALQGKVDHVNADGTLDPQGQAELSTYEYNQYLLTLKNQTATKSQSGWFDPRGTAKLNTGTIYAQFATLKTNSKRTGEAIQANLTKSATVRIGYYYYEENKPPAASRYLKAADGGWVSGPGGPREDKVPAMLSNREFVVNAAAAAQYGPLLEAINRVGGQGGGNSREVIAGAAAKAAFPNTGPAVPTRAAALMSSAPGRPQTVVHVTNYYPQAEPTSTTVNRSLAFAAQLDGTL